MDVLYIGKSAKFQKEINGKVVEFERNAFTTHNGFDLTIEENRNKLKKHFEY